MRTKTRSAFTLIELLVVIAIIAILAAILFPVFAKAREKAEQTQCISNVKQVALGILMYSEDYDSKLPTNAAVNAVVLGWKQMINPYTKNDQILKCPTQDSDVGVDYALNSYTNGAKRGRIPSPAGTILLFDSQNVPDGTWTAMTAAPAQPYPVRFGHLGDPDVAAPNLPDGMASVAFCDGHAKSQKWGDVRYTAGALPWERK